MEFLGIDINVKNIPELDPGFIPLYKFNAAFLEGAKKPLGVAVERAGGEIAVQETFIHGTPELAEADRYYAARLVKSMLWLYGGWKVYISGDRSVYEAVKADYAPGGAREFDADFMANVYERPFEVVFVDGLPAEYSRPQAVGRHLDGCRIGFDAGGSDRKVSAVIDGESGFSEEVVWYPKVTEDPDYHFEGIVSALRSAAAHMPRVDAIGVSSAGIYIDNRTMVASLFLKVPKDKFDAKVKDIYIRAAKEIGDVPLVVANDGDVTALAGAMSLGENNILGIAMGTSEAVGYVDENGNITGWLSELAFMRRRHQAGAARGHRARRVRAAGGEAEGCAEADGGRRRARGGRLPQHRRLSGALPGALLRLLRLQIRAAAGPRDVRPRRRHGAGHLQGRAGGRVSRPGGEDRPHAAGREVPPRGPVRRRRLAALHAAPVIRRAAH